MIEPPKTGTSSPDVSPVLVTCQPDRHPFLSSLRKPQPAGRTTECRHAIDNIIDVFPDELT